MWFFLIIAHLLLACVNSFDSCYRHTGLGAGVGEQHCQYEYFFLEVYMKIKPLPEGF